MSKVRYFVAFGRLFGEDETYVVGRASSRKSAEQQFVRCMRDACSVAEWKARVKEATNMGCKVPVHILAVLWSTTPIEYDVDKLS